MHTSHFSGIHVTNKKSLSCSWRRETSCHVCVISSWHTGDKNGGGAHHHAGSSGRCWRGWRISRPFSRRSAPRSSGTSPACTEAPPQTCWERVCVPVQTCSAAEPQTHARRLRTARSDRAEEPVHWSLQTKPSEPSKPAAEHRSPSSHKT